LKIYGSRVTEFKDNDTATTALSQQTILVAICWNQPLDGRNGFFFKCGLLTGTWLFYVLSKQVLQFIKGKA